MGQGALQVLYRAGFNPSSTGGTDAPTSINGFPHGAQTGYTWLHYTGIAGANWTQSDISNSTHAPVEGWSYVKTGEQKAPGIGPTFSDVTPPAVTDVTVADVKAGSTSTTASFKTDDPQSRGIWKLDDNGAWFDLPFISGPDNLRTWTIKDLTPGVHTLYIRIWDLANNNTNTWESHDGTQFKVFGAPTITQQPFSPTTSVGQDASFTAKATGYPDPTYQWQRMDGQGHWVNVDGGDQATLTVTNATMAMDQGKYRVQATNDYGAADSDVVTLYVWAHPQSQYFVDVPGDNMYYTQINWMGTSGYATGWQVAGGHEYRPLESIHRDAFAAFMYRLAGSPDYTAPTTSPFSDMAPSDEYYKEICWLQSKGIATGYDDGTFRPLDDVNRDAMAAFLYRFNASPDFTAPTTSPFRDVTTGQQFYKEMAWLSDKGISTGWPDGTYRPVTPVARDAMAAFIYRMKN
ncbi:S-layer homology domain-containing protein [Propionibacterium freudenreichii]|uniref:S-layer homology domain-containing protein n=1 Tax=Propionibacterium freudenreichii TaxID=1744 RepID=UPI0021A51796|nr:S-layer homology domain-containing protein [Propionibacterium freudenreichii]